MATVGQKFYTQKVGTSILIEDVGGEDRWWGGGGYERRKHSCERSEQALPRS